jgi:methylated-DNA-[protein]-cysteine S-methyltransferase
MTSKPSTCVAIEPDLIAAATGEAVPSAAGRVDAHIAQCASCRNDYAHYRAVETVVGDLRMSMAPADAADARRRLIERLSDLRSRLVHYRVAPSPLGPILIGVTEQGVSLVEYLGRGGAPGSRLFRETGVEAVEGGAELERLHRELHEFIEGRRTHLDWSLDLRSARSEFQRQVMQATVAVPYGAVASYAGIARELGRPAAVRAVAQALRHNPLPIVVPCHRIIGSTGKLVGYAGNKIGLKEQLLGVEGVPVNTRAARIEREAMYHYDPNPDHQYCLPTCGSILRRPLAQVRLFAHREQAAASGLEPCVDCRPDLHPLSR